MKKRRESAIEKEFRKYVESLGGDCYKFVSPGNRGVADRIIMLNGVISVFELKATGETLDPLQEYFQRRAKKQKVPYGWADNIEDAKKFVHENHILPRHT